MDLKASLSKAARPALLALCLVAATVAVHAQGETPSAHRASLRERIAERLEQRQQARDGAPAASEGDARLGVGEHSLKLRHDGLERKALVHVPAGYRAGQPMPLVLAFHGGGGHAEYMADDERYGLISAAERHGFIVAFPNGYSKLPGGRFATWNAGGCCGDARDRQVDDVGFVRVLVRRLQAQLSIDARRIYATGMSNGGMMSHRLACDAADLFAAVAAVAGTDATSRCQPSRPIAVLHIHARDDSHVLFDGGAGKDAFRDRSQVMDFVSVPETMARWSQRDQCRAEPRRVLDKPGAYCDRWEPCASGAELQLCVTETGGHSWPGAEKTRRGKPGASQAIDADETIWEFFSRHRLP